MCKDCKCARLKAENERLKLKLDTVEADYEASKIEMQDRINFLKKLNNNLLKLYNYTNEENKKLNKMTGIFSGRLCKKYYTVLQEIKGIVSKIINGYLSFDEYYQLRQILDLITKAESEG